MRTAACIAATVLLGVAALPAQEKDPDRAVAGGGNLPTGWSVRTDRGTGADHVKFAVMGDGYHLTLGPRVILYREADTISGSYTVSATFIKAQPQRHAEAYGLIIGGSNLQDDDQQYSYFLIRGAGEYLVKNRNGSKTSSVSGSWTAHQAINAEDRAGNATNTLTVEVNGDQVRFLVNGSEVYTGSSDQLKTEGIVGLRANHNLDLHIDGFAVEAG